MGLLIVPCPGSMTTPSLDDGLCRPRKGPSFDIARYLISCLRGVWLRESDGIATVLVFVALVFKGILPWMDELLQHARNPGMMSLLEVPTSNGFQ